MFDDWVQGVMELFIGIIMPTSQETTNLEKTYLGKESMEQILKPGNRTHYKPDATKSEDPYLLKESP